MALQKIADKVVDTDVLVVGGGIGGCPLAAKAAEHGLKVTLVEKSKTERSGSAAHGMDHYGIFPRGISTLEVVKRWQEGGMLELVNGPGRWVNPNIDYVQFDNAFWALEEMERLGLPMKWDDGEYYWMPHLIHGPGLKLGLRVHWQNIKLHMARMVRERGVNVLDRVMIVDLLTNKGEVTGATAINTRTGEFIVIKAKAVVIATGMFCRNYDPEMPLFWKYKFAYHRCPAVASGDGWAIAYRAGAGLAHMDITGWCHRVRDLLTISFGSFPNNDGIPSKIFDWKGNEPPAIAERTPTGYEEVAQAGLTPIYQSLEHLPDDYQKRLEVAYADEYLLALKMAQDRGFNPRTHRYEFNVNKPLEMMLIQGIYVDDSFKSPSLKGLYAIGDCAAGMVGCHGAAVPGLVLGDRIHTAVSGAGEPVIDEGQVESQKQATLAPLAVKDGTVPMELECAVRYVCERYVGNFKTEGMLREGLRRFNSLKREFLPKLMAKNPHYLMRCLEVRNIMDLAELHIQACLERKETRGNYVRLDYPKRDPSRDNMLTHQRLEKGKPVLEILEVPTLKPEYAKEGK